MLKKDGIIKLNNAAKSPAVKTVLLTGLAALLLLTLSFALNFIISDVITPERDIIYDWSFAVGGSEADINDAAIWKTASKVRQVTVTPQGEFYRFKHILPPSGEQWLTVTTDRAPVKITLDGNELFNNGYGTADYVSNKVVVVRIPQGDSERQLDVYMNVPFSAEMQAVLSEQAPKISAVYVNLSAAAGIFGITCMLFAVILALFFKKSFRLTLPGLITAAFSLLLSLQLAGGADLLGSDRLWYNLTVFSAALFMTASLTAIIVCFNRWTLPMGISSAMSYLCLPLLLFVNSAAALKAVVILIALSFFATAFFAARELYGIVKQRILNSTAVMVMLFYLGFYTIARLSAYIFDIKALAVVDITFAVAFIFTLSFTLIKQFIASEREQRAKHESINGVRWLERLHPFCNGLFAENQEEKYIIKAVTAVADFTESFFSDRGTPTDIACCAAILTKDGYKELYNNGIKECLYSVAAEKAQRGKQTAFSGTYFDIVLTDNESPRAVLHFEGITDGLDEYFHNSIMTVYSGVMLGYPAFGTAEELVQKRVFADLASSIEIRSGSASYHLENVAAITRVLCAELKLSEQDVEEAAYASMLHDIGKIAVPSSILAKSGRLTISEKEIIKKHTEFGYTILSAVSGRMMRTAAVMAREHHERFDGTGYAGLKGDNISIYARIVTAADVFDALTSVRSYKEAWTDTQALKYLQDNAGKEFDPKVIEAFTTAFKTICNVKRSNAGRP